MMWRGIAAGAVAALLVVGATGCTSCTKRDAKPTPSGTLEASRLVTAAPATPGETAAPTDAQASETPVPGTGMPGGRATLTTPGGSNGGTPGAGGSGSNAPGGGSTGGGSAGGTGSGGSGSLTELPDINGFTKVEQRPSEKALVGAYADGKQRLMEVYAFHQAPGEQEMLSYFDAGNVKAAKGVPCATSPQGTVCIHPGGARPYAVTSKNLDADALADVVKSLGNL